MTFCKAHTGQLSSHLPCASCLHLRALQELEFCQLINFWARTVSPSFGVLTKGRIRLCGLYEVKSEWSLCRQLYRCLLAHWLQRLHGRHTAWGSTSVWIKVSPLRLFTSHTVSGSVCECLLSKCVVTVTCSVVVEASDLPEICASIEPQSMLRGIITASRSATLPTLYVNSPVIMW